MRIVSTMTPVYRQKSSYLKKIRKRKKLSREGIYSFSLILLHTDAHTNVNSLTPV